MQLGYALALVHKKTTIDEHVYSLLKKVACDLVPPQRLTLLKYLWQQDATEFTRGWCKTKQISEDTAMPTQTAKLILEDLMVAKVLNRMTEGEGDRSPYNWQIRERLFEYIASAEVFESVEIEVPAEGTPF
jgi:NurA-like 5'-3' nuclease